jgi:geranylgeranyl reductase family protein
MLEIAVVGGGPAGSYCAYYLAGNNHYPVIFDHTHPREKPCGGLVTPFTQRLFPLLTKLPIKHGEKRKIRLISPSGRQVCLSSRKGKFRSFSRLELDQFLVNMAVDKGAKLIEEKVVALERKKDFWKVKTTRRFYHAKVLIGADGVNSLVRRSIIGPLRKVDKGVCCGYLVRGLEKEDITVSFSARRKGYMWVIPRYDQTSLGIGTFEASRSHGLRRELDIFIEQQYPNVQIVSKWAALTPNVKNLKTLQIPVAGSNWILIGDAAGHVSPITGEGIVYALLDGELAAKAVIENKPEMFNKLWKEAYGTSLFIDVTLRKGLYTRPGLELICEFLKLQNAFVP